MASSKNRGKVWRDEATTTLIDLWSEETIQFSLENCKTSKESSEVYRSLQVQLHQKGFDTFTLKEVVNKMKKLRQKYKLEKDKNRKSGNSSEKKPWKFFTRMDMILSHRHNVNPPTIMDTMSVNECQDIPSCVNELVKKYGQGEVTTEQCNICGFEQEMHSSGVHETEGGSLKVYAADDALICPNCNRDEPGDVDKENVSVKPTDKQKQDNIIPKRKRKSNIEKSLEVVFEKFKQSSNDEFLRFQQFEEERLKREHEFKAKEREEERKHELDMMRLLLGSQHTPVNAMPADLQPNTYPIVQMANSTYFDLS